MEVYLTDLFTEAKQFFAASIIMDGVFLSDLMDAYRSDLINLYKKFQGKNDINVATFSIPREVIEFFDGNGFDIRESEVFGGTLDIERM